MVDITENSSALNKPELVHRTEHKGAFTMIANSIRNSGLSLQAKGLLVHLLTLPRDWCIHPEQVMAEANVKYDAFYSAWNELKAAGYIVVLQRRDSQGRAGKSEIHVFDNPEVATVFCRNVGPHVRRTGHRKTRSSGNPVTGETGKRKTGSFTKTDRHKEHQGTKIERDSNVVLFLKDTGEEEPTGGHSESNSSLPKNPPGGTSETKPSAPKHPSGGHSESSPASHTDPGGPKADGAGGQKEDWAFEAGVVKVSAADLAKLRSAYRSLNVKDELRIMAPWLETKRADWHGAMLNLLAKLEREERAKAEARSNPTEFR